MIVRVVIMVLLMIIMSPLSARAEVDPSAVVKLFGKSARGGLQPNAKVTSDQQALDGFAAYETKHLDQGDPAWNASDPNWKSVYLRVRTDLVGELPQVLAAERAAAPEAERGFEADIALQLQPADAEAILNYYRTTEGQRYQTFQRQVEPLVAAGAPSPGEANSPANPAIPQDEMKRDFRVLQLSRTYQAFAAKAMADRAAHRDTSGYEAITFMTAFAIRRKPEVLKELDAKFGADLSSFEDFSKSASAQHFFLALGEAVTRASERNAKISEPIVAWLESTYKKHAAEWSADYVALSKNADAAVKSGP